MAVPNRDPSQNKYPEQYMQNTSFDEDFGVNAVEVLEYDGSSLHRKTTGNVATKITEVGDVTYIATAPAGTAQSTAGWQVKKIDASTGVVITWADGNTAFDNVATDLTALSYS